MFLVTQRPHAAPNGAWDYFEITVSINMSLLTKLGWVEVSMEALEPLAAWPMPPDSYPEHAPWRIASH